MGTAIGLNEIGLYNPQRQGAEVTKALFVVHQKQFDSLLRSITTEKKGSRPQHYLIIGQRGMGKTTLLKRIEVELHDEPYRKHFIPLLFPEEQYNLKNITTFWLNCLDALANSLEVEKYSGEITTKIDNTVKELSKKTIETASEESFNFLMNTCRDLQRRPVLLIDNIELVFKRLEKHGQHDLRSVLSENGAPIIIGGGVVRTSNVTDYGMPFYDFFQFETLAKLSYEEFVELLKNLATITHSDEIVFKSIRENAARQRALYGLTGGNPRITVMLFKFILKGFANDINTDLEALADEVTPLFKAKYEELSEQQQIVLDAIAMNWHPIPLNQISLATGYASEQLTTPLFRLRESGWLETTSADKVKGNAYSISERFFNIWFLMRCSRRHKEGVYCLSRFLECFYGKEELERISDNLLEQDICSSRQMLVSMAISKSEIVDPKKRKRHDDNINKALECLNKAIELNPKNYHAWANKGFSLIELKNYEESAFAYEKSRSIVPEDLLNKFHLMFLYRDKLSEMDKAIKLFNEIEQKINNDENKKYVSRYCVNKALFDLHNQNKGLAKENLLQAFEVLENENKILSIANEYWWRRFGSVVIELGYGSWLLAILEEKRYDIVLSPYYTAIQFLEIEKQDSKNGQKDAEIYLKNRAIEISEPAREIIKNMRI